MVVNNETDSSSSSSSSYLLVLDESVIVATVNAEHEAALPEVANLTKRTLDEIEISRYSISTKMNAIHYWFPSRFVVRTKKLTTLDYTVISCIFNAAHEKSKIVRFRKCRTIYKIQWNLVITKGLRQQPLLRYNEIIRYNETFLLRLAL